MDSRAVINFCPDVRPLAVAVAPTWTTCALKFALPPAPRAGGG
jgi:hypothetical protein